ncbi:MAG: hypothetical protein JWR85_706 [Marmoricola sp.]|jgi:hypothetical protein|nr:hypothetical protein [Marmoricola sp.]MDQ1617640.1 hypothetical protein [Actinomycetota bacterium]MDQ1670762.1 hypothetical protein [Actinomycetota bacterium]
MSFRRTVEDFTCQNCGTLNHGDGYTNHCSRCLHSKHVDVAPGDRDAQCQGLMVPVDVQVERGRRVLVHRCARCGVERRCRTSDEDDVAVMNEIMRTKATRFMTGG